uniref:Uncharacterized protein n=1 Tax=Sphaerodactylus townsendi TaxID=933632 RepID=A0ACB8GDJ0_9SAUR
MESSNGRPCARLILSGVVAYVDVWSSNRTENYSKGFIQQLLDMGAKVSKTFSKQVTHVVFKEGHWSTWNKAQKTGIKLVSVLWVEKCREVRACVDESLYPAINTNEGILTHILFVLKHKCMQPRDFVEKTPENDRRLQKKLRTMAKDLEVQKATTEVDIPVLLFEDDGSLFYSPTSKIQYESSSMEKRIMDMKERRENLSPTASQMSQVSGSSSVQATQEPVIVSASSTWVLSEEESGGSLNSSFTNLWGNSEHKGLWKDSSKSSLEVLNTPVSSAALGGSPFLTDDWNHASPKQPRDKHLQKRRIRPKTLERDFLNKRAESEMPTPEKHDDRNDHLPHKKKLDCRRSSEKVIQVEIAESSNDHSHSETDAEYFTDFASTNLTFSPLKSNCVFGSKQTPKRRSRIKLNTSALCRRDSENDFLKAVLTPNKSTKDQGSSYEDYFSESNLNRGKVSLPLSSLQKLQSSSERVYKCSPSQSEQGAMLQKSSTNEKSVSRKRKKVAENNENVAGSSYIQSVFPNSKESATLNCMLEGEKVNTAESPEYFLNLDVQQKMHITVANRCHLTTGEEMQFTEVKSEEMQFTEVFLVQGSGFVVLGKTIRGYVDSTDPDRSEFILLQQRLVLNKFPKQRLLSLVHDFEHFGELRLGDENKLCKFDGNDDYLEVREPNKKLQTTGRIKKPLRTLVMTSMCSEQKNTVVQVAKKLGNFLFSNEVCENTSHVISGSPRRTLNVLLGIARGCWIVSFEWVLWSLEYGHWISEEPYELSVDFPAAPVSNTWNA